MTSLRTGLHLPSATVLDRPIGPHRRVEWRSFDLATVKALGRRLGGKVNDVVLAIVTGAMRRFLTRRGERLGTMDYRVVVPVNMRSSSGEPAVANRDAAFFLSLPVAEPDPATRFAAVCAETTRLKDSHAADGIDFLAQLVDRTGSTWLTGVFARIALRIQPYNQIVSNVPGPQFPRKMNLWSWHSASAHDIDAMRLRQSSRSCVAMFLAGSL